MSEAVATTTVNEVKNMSDGSVKIAVEKYNELLETIASQKGSISNLNARLQKALNEPPIINKTIVEKTDEMLSSEHRAWGGTLMGLGAAFFAVGAIRYTAGRS